MAYPPAYVRAYSFTDYETNNPGQPKPGDKLDNEYDAVANALTATQTNLALIQRADGALANGSVGEDQLDPTLFVGLGDAATADAEAAAAAAAASAGAAASSALASADSATAAGISASTASGAAAQAGVSQGIAQSAANEAALSATDASNSADVSVQASNDTAGSTAACEAHVQRAFEWAELLTGPVLPAPPGWPEAVDDGMFSSKWWAIRARDYMTVTHLDLGSGQTDIGQAFADWLAIPGNTMPLGLLYATWGTPPLEYALTDPSDPTDPASWTLISGGPGPPGPPNTLTVGTVNTGAPGSAALVSITGTAPNQVLNMQIPAGSTGATGPIGPAGPPNALAIGTVTTVPDGSPAGATITGTAPTQTLNLTIPAGPQGIQGIQGIQGPVGPAVNVADPTGLVGLVAVNGVATTAPRSDSSPALNQAIAPNWTGLHQFSSTAGAAGGSFQIVTNAPTFVLWDMSQAANSRAWYTQASGANYNLGIMDDAVSVAKRALNITRVANAVATMSFGNATDNPTYTFLGTGAGSVAGVWTFTGPVTRWDSANPSIRLTSTTAGTNKKRWDFVVYAADGSFTGRHIDDTETGSAAWLSVIASGTGVGLTSISFGDASNPAFAFLGVGTTTFGGNINLAGPHLQIKAHSALTDTGDGWLYLNSQNHYTAGIYGGGIIRTDTGFQSDGGLANTANNRSIKPNNGALPYGTVYVTGVNTGYAGYTVNDGGLTPSFMSNGTTVYGIHGYGDSKWLIQRDSITTAQTGYSLSAPAFTTTSARAIKRETGAPSTAANILARLRPLLYRLLDGDDREQLGLIAEEVHEVCPQLSDGKTVAYDRLAILLLAAWQDEHVVA